MLSTSSRSTSSSARPIMLAVVKPPAQSSPSLAYHSREAITAFERFRFFDRTDIARLQATPVFLDLPRSIVPGDARDPASGMGRRAAQVQGADRGTVVGEVRRRALEEQLVDRELAVKDMTVGAANEALDVRRYQHLHGDDVLAEAWSELLERIEHELGEFLPVILPARSISQGIGSMTAKQVEDVLARRSERAVHGRRGGHRHEGTLRVPPLLRIGIGLLQVGDIGRHMRIRRILEATQLAVERGELRQALAGNVE